MSLSNYNKKRKFDQTPEPEDKKTELHGPLTFVVQKHLATRLHYDFRLELDGVLKSWAVPRGPSLNPQDKRLAVFVEDHPIDYASFEGIIPKKNYGAGTVMVWDQGVYSPVVGEEDRLQVTGDRKKSEKVLLRQLSEGHLTFIMLGKKLKGEFALIQAKSSDDPKVWFLVKAGDEYASLKDITEEDKSVVSKRSLEQIAKKSEGEKKVWVSKPKDLDLDDSPQGKMPSSVKPMLATSVEKPFSNKDWIYEIKWDGYRTIAEIKSANVQLYSRNGQSFDEKFEKVRVALKKFPGNAVLDGEVVVLNKQGLPDFQLLQDYPKSGGELVYNLFDILFFDGRDLTQLPLLKRKEILASLIPESSLLKFSDHVEEEGVAFFEQVQGLHLEGVMAKKADSVYQKGVRSKSWLKMKTLKIEDVVIGGYTKGRGGRSYFGALVVGQYEGKKLVYRGHVGGGFNERKLKDIYEKLSRSTTVNCPFEEEPVTNEKVTWVKPKFFCEVSFSNWTSEQIMRHPLFVKLVDSGQAIRGSEEPSGSRRVTGDSNETPPLPNPPPHQVDSDVHWTSSGGRGLHRDLEGVGSGKILDGSVQSPSPLVGEGRGEGDGRRVFAKESPGKEEETELTVSKRVLRITNPSKLFWPKEGLRKMDVISYYREMVSMILPYLKDRPQSLLRYPNGILEEGFFQKDASNLRTDWLMRASVKFESKGAETEFLLCQDEASLVYMANLGCIDMHPWNSTIKNIENPDYLIIDLDPEAVPFSGVVKVALVVREFLEKLGVESFPKTSGSRGIHIFIPMGGKYDHDQVRIFAELLCNHIQVEDSSLMSTRRNPADRQKKVYLDYLQNGRGKTLASVYSVRPKPGAFVSTPLEWKEVNEKLHPSLFTMKETLKRIEKKGDLFKGVLGSGIDMEKVLNKISQLT